MPCRCEQACPKCRRESQDEMKVFVWVVESGFPKGNRGFVLHNPEHWHKLQESRRSGRRMHM